MARFFAGESVRSVASILSVSAATVVRWSGRHRATGSAAPGKIGGHKVGILSGGHRDWLLERATRDFTLRGLAPLRGWAPRGRRLHAKVPYGHWRTMTFLAALRCDRIDAPCVLDQRAAIRSAGARLLFLPPYRPDLNPIEQVFAKLKHLMRKAAERTHEDTWKRIGLILNDFPPAECAAYL